MAERAKAARPLLIAQRQAVLDYLDALLRELPEEYPVDAPATAAPVLAPVLAPVMAPILPVEAPAAAALPPATVRAAAPVLPEWAEPDFQALLFQVGALKLAVPLVKLHSVIPWSEQVTPMPNQPLWCHGLLRYRERNVRVVDTATLVLPAEKREQPIARNHMLVLEGGEWALSCSEIGTVIKLAPHEVKWRREAGQRPWLAGTVLGQLCALLDTQAFASMLAAKQTRPAADKPGIR
jgi:purine-binding chemotaxis protein CheW